MDTVLSRLSPSILAFWLAGEVKCNSRTLERHKDAPPAWLIQQHR